MKKLDFISVFPNIRTDAYYNPFAQYIGLNTYTTEAFEKYTKDGISIENIEFYKTLIHEVRHFDDHITTLWGQKNLISAYNAIVARLTNDPTKFHFIASYLKENRRQNFRDYYSYVQSKIKPTGENNLWMLAMSCGLRFNHEGYLDESMPLLFVTFHSHDNKTIARVPLTIESLLETNAVNEEAKAHIAHVFNLPPGPLHVEFNQMKKDFIYNRFYNPELTLYSVATHLVSNIWRIKDMGNSIFHASQVANLVLNIQESEFDNLKIPQSYLERWGDRNMAFIKNRDKGYLFAVMVENYASSYKGEILTNIEGVLKASNLPNSTKLKENAISEMSGLKETILEGNPFPKLEIYLEEGLNIFKKRNIDYSHYISTVIINNDKISPMIMLNDTEWELGQIEKDTKYEDMTFPQWWEFSQHIESKLEDFYKGCGY